MRPLLGVIVCLNALSAAAAEYSTAIYKTVDDRELQVHIVTPDGHSASARATAVVYFHPGGWRQGSAESGFVYAEALAEHRIVTLAVEYRLADSVTLDEIIKDAASAMRWTRERARRLGIDAGKIIAFGHSAGGHLAASTAMLSGFDEADDYTRASPRPNALVLMAPADASKTGIPYIPSGADAAAYEPRQNINRRIPPTLIIQGDLDETVLPAQSVAFHDALKAIGVNSTLLVLPGVRHRFERDDAKAVVSAQIVKFAQDLGFL